MAVVSTSQPLQLLPILFLLLLVAGNEAVMFTIINRCSDTVWPAAVPVGGGRRLDPGQVWVLDVPSGTMSGRIWARTGCSFDGNGNGTCQTGGCGGVLACTSFGQPPVTLAELTIGLAQTNDYFDISVIDGFNVPIEFLPVLEKGEQRCSKGPRCSVNITSQCPSEMKVPGGCNNVCTSNTSSSCTYSSFFKQMCPDVYSLLTDSATFTCPTGTNYQVVFCPSINLAVPPGYLAPEWLTSQITEKADVYSFGVVIMEIISGRKSLDYSRSEESIHLISLLEEKVKSDCLVDLIDKHSNDMQAHEQDAIQMMKLAMWCLQFDCKRRPKMYEVIKVLEGTMDIETNMDHNFVATCPANFGIDGSASSSAPPQASDVSGPR